MPRKRVIQEHHIRYKSRDGQDETVMLYKGEHQIISLINLYTRKKVSKGFIFTLERWLNENRNRGEDIGRSQ